MLNSCTAPDTAVSLYSKCCAVRSVSCSPVSRDMHWHCPAAPTPFLSQLHCLAFSRWQQCCFLSQLCRSVKSSTVGPPPAQPPGVLENLTQRQSCICRSCAALAFFCGWRRRSCAARSIIGILLLHLRRLYCSCDALSAVLSVALLLQPLL